MGVPIFASRKFVSNTWIPVPRKINRAVGQDSPDGSTRSVFWNRHKSTDLAVVTDDTLLSNPEFEYLIESEYLSERKSNGDWNIRPKDRVISNVCSEFEDDEHVFFMLKDEWLADDPKGFYILTTSDLIRYLPCIEELKNELAQLRNVEASYDRKRFQEGGHSSNTQIRSLVTIIERTGLTDLESLVDQVFTTGRVETDFDLPRPE